jgi:hypothetical protein
MESSLSGRDPIVGSCEHGDEIPDSTKMMNISLAERISASQEIKGHELDKLRGYFTSCSRTWVAQSV